MHRARTVNPWSIRPCSIAPGKTSMDYDCIIVGAGVLGSSSAYQLVKDGYKILLLDQFPLPHSRGSSHGAVRILRYPYSNYDHQTAMPEQYQMWSQLEKEASTTLTHETPSAILTPSRNEVFVDKLNIARKSGITCSELKESQFVERYPMLQFQGLSVFMYDILIIDAHKAVQCLQNEFVKRGGTLLDDVKVLKIEPGPVVTVHTNRGRRFRSKGLILTPGPWASKLLQPLGIDLPLKVWRVNVCYFKEKEPGSHSNIPINLMHADDGAENIFLVFPSREFPGFVKVNYHNRWDEVDPDERDKNTDKVQHDIEVIKEFVKKYLPGLETHPSIIEPCLYTCTPNEDLIVGKHPLHSNIAIGCSMSGKGFKMAPLIGRVLGEMATGRQPSFDTRLIGIERHLPNIQPKL